MCGFECNGGKDGTMAETIIGAADIRQMAKNIMGSSLTGLFPVEGDAADRLLDSRPDDWIAAFVAAQLPNREFNRNLNGWDFDVDQRWSEWLEQYNGPVWSGWLGYYECTLEQPDATARGFCLEHRLWHRGELASTGSFS